MSSSSSSSKPKGTFSVESGDILRLIQAHLTECGLHESCRVLLEESGIRGAGVCHSSFQTFAMKGQWDLVLDSLATLDRTRSHLSASLLADVYETAILELAEKGEVQLAYAFLRLAEDDLDASSQREDARVGDPEHSIPRSRVLEQRLAALTSLRSSDPEAVPPDYYGTMSKEERRRDIGSRLAEAVPQVPPLRLVTLIQQAIKWQSHTGELPMMKNHWEQDEDEEATDHETHKKRKRKKRRRVFDLVLGQAEAPETTVGDQTVVTDVAGESIPSSPYSVVKFGKKATAESAVYLPDASGLVTGTSDGLVEIWGPPKYSQLRLDLPYQEKEDFLWHESAITSLAVSNDGAMVAGGAADGAILVWRIDTGKCLRQFSAHDGQVVSCLTFSNDGSRVLSGSHDSTCREFGLRTSHMLKEFRGHTSYVNQCHYVLTEGGSHLRVITGSADGTVRIWEGKTSESLYVLRPASLGNNMSSTGASILMETNVQASTDDGASPNVHSVLPMHSPAQSMIIVPRGKRAFLVTLRGSVVRTFDSDDGGVFVAATVSPSNRWLYAVTEAGACCVFNVLTGNMEKTIRDFALESGSGRDKSVAEITGLLHDPHDGVLAAFSSDKGQKRGLLTLWK